MNQTNDIGAKLVVLYPGVEAAVVDGVGQSAAVEPSGQPRRHPFVARLDSLRGKRLALLDNSKFRAKDLLIAFGQQLQDKYGIGEIKLWGKSASAIGCSFFPEIMEWKPDLFLTASGD